MRSADDVMNRCEMSFPIIHITGIQGKVKKLHFFGMFFRFFCFVKGCPQTAFYSLMVMKKTTPQYAIYIGCAPRC